MDQLVLAEHSGVIASARAGEGTLSTSALLRRCRRRAGLAVVLLVAGLQLLSAPARAATNPIRNGDFSQGLSYWPVTTVATGSFIGYPKITASTTPQCFPAQKDNPFLQIDVPGHADGYVQQQIAVPPSPEPLMFLTWGNLDPTTATISIVTAGNVVHKVLSYTPPSLQATPSACSGLTPITKSIDMTPFAGQSVGVRFEATSSGINGTIADFDNISLGKPLRSTATSVSCDYHVATGTDTCTATVGDADAPPRVTPTGAVTFASQSGGTLSGHTCSLTPTPLSPGVASCAVQWLPPNSNFPKITASYSGDSTHSGSAGSTTFKIPTNVPGVNDNGQTTGPCTAESQGESRSPAADVIAAAKKTLGEKLCSLTAMGAAGYIAYLTCGSTVVVTATGQVEISWVPAIACVLSLYAAGVNLDYLLDPASRSFLELALPSSPPVGAVHVLGKCRSQKRGPCTKLRRAFDNDFAALMAFAKAQGGLGQTGDRLIGARKAKDVRAILLQIAARKLYAGQVAATAARLNRRAQELRALLLRWHIDIRANLAASQREVARHLPNSLLPALKRMGISQSEFKRNLRAAVDRLAGSRDRISLVDYLRRPFPYSAYLRDYRSMTLENLRALVTGLGRRGTISSRSANTLLYDLACVKRRHPKPNLKAFLRHVRSAARRPYASLLTFAAAPLRRTSVCR